MLKSLTGNSIARKRTAVQPVDLYLQGYRAQLLYGTLVITNPHGRQYRVDPIAKTCSCPSTHKCKHLMNWFALCMEQANALCWDASGEMTKGGMRQILTGAEIYAQARALRTWAYTTKETTG